MVIDYLPLVEAALLHVRIDTVRHEYITNTAELIGIRFSFLVPDEDAMGIGLYC